MTHWSLLNISAMAWLDSMWLIRPCLDWWIWLWLHLPSARNNSDQRRQTLTHWSLLHECNGSVRFNVANAVFGLVDVAMAASVANGVAIVLHGKVCKWLIKSTNSGRDLFQWVLWLMNQVHKCLPFENRSLLALFYVPYHHLPRIAVLKYALKTSRLLLSKVSCSHELCLIFGESFQAKHFSFFLLNFPKSGINVGLLKYSDKCIVGIEMIRGDFGFYVKQ